MMQLSFIIVSNYTSTAINRLLLPALDFGTVYMSTFSLFTHNISPKTENSFISAILHRHYFITVSP